MKGSLVTRYWDGRLSNQGWSAATALLLLCVTAGLLGWPGHASASSKGKSSGKVEEKPLPALDLKAVLAGGSQTLRVGRTVTPPARWGEKHPLDRMRSAAGDPNLARLETWSDAKGQVILLGGVFHEHFDQDADTFLSSLGLTKGQLLGSYRPRPGDPGASQSHRHYHTLLTVYATNKSDVWLSYERDRKLYGIYRGRNARAMADAQGVEAAAQADNYIGRVRQTYKLWEDTVPEWNRPGDDRARRRLELYGKIIPEIDKLPSGQRFDASFGLPVPSPADLRKDILADFEALMGKASAGESFYYQALIEYPRALERHDTRARIVGLLSQTASLESAVGYVEFTRRLSPFLNVVAIPSDRNSPTHKKHRELLERAVHRAASQHRQAGQPTLADLELLTLRMTPGPNPAVVESLRTRLVPYDQITDPIAKLDWLIANKPADSSWSHASDRQQGNMLFALLLLPSKLASSINEACDAASYQGCHATAVGLRMKMMAAETSSHRVACMSLKQAATEANPQSIQRAAVTFWVAVAPALHSENHQGFNLHRRLKEVPYLTMPLMAYTGLLPDEMDDIHFAIGGLGQQARFVNVSLKGDALTIEPAPVMPSPSSYRYTGLTDLGWVGVSAETRKEGERLRELSQAISEEKEKLDQQKAALDVDQPRINQRIDEFNQKAKSQSFTQAEFDRQKNALERDRSALNQRIDAYNTASRNLSTRIDQYNKDVSANNLRRNTERSAGLLKMRSELDGALSQWFDAQLAAYEQQLKDKRLPEQAIRTEMQWARWLTGRGPAPIAATWRKSDKPYAERLFVFYESEIWQQKDTAGMAQMFIQALQVASELGQPGKLEPSADRFVRQHTAKDLEQALLRLNTPDAQRMLTFVRNVKLK